MTALENQPLHLVQLCTTTTVQFINLTSAGIHNYAYSLFHCKIQCCVLLSMQNVVEGAIGCMLQDQKGAMDQILKHHTHQGNDVLVAALTRMNNVRGSQYSLLVVPQ